jgi:choline kinase
LEINSLKAIILSAGEGKRLRPLTDKQPKCLVNLFGKSLLQWQLEIFQSLNITDITIVKGYLGHKINLPNITYFQNLNYDTTNMVETLFCAREKLTESVIVSYGDIIFEQSVMKKLMTSDEDISVVIDKNWKSLWDARFANPENDVESLVMNKDGFITNIGQKIKNLNEIQGQYIGLMKFQNEGIKNLIDFYDNAKTNSSMGKNILNPNIPFEKSYMTDLIQGLINNNCRVASVPINGGWLEVDSINDYNLYQQKYADNKISEFINLEY